ncbi:MAG TPA: hypothetical protein VF656_08310 [Pyrinomonadaceae bacterium]|jgi:hypothetical protein
MASLFTIVIALGLIVVATRSGRSYAATEKKTLRVLRKKEHLAVKPTAQEIVAAQSPEVERELEDKIPKHLPLKIKIKNLNSEKWARDLEVEVKNTGDKPIYYLSFSLSLPEVKSDGGVVLGFDLRFGRPELSRFSNRPLPDDVPIQPGETYILKVPLNQAKGWELFKGRRNLSDPKKFQIKFHLLHYGDGTGFMTTGGLPVPNPNAPRSSCEEKKGDVADALSAAAQVNSPNNPPLQFSSSFMPVNFAPAKFSTAKVVATALSNASSDSDLCCSGRSNCSYAREVQDGQICATCGPANWVESVGCGDPDGYCGKREDEYRTCPDAYGYEAGCTFYFLDPCPPPGMTPPPTPTPNATPTPSPTSTPSPQCTEDCTRCNPYGYCETNFPPYPYCALPACPYGPPVDTCTYPQTGCPGNAYNGGGGCCKCVNENPTCESGFVWDKDKCECVFAPTPTPTATLTPGGGGGGYYCTEYYWVTWESYDGGQTWHEVNRAYVGCW